MWYILNWFQRPWSLILNPWSGFSKKPSSVTRSWSVFVSLERSGAFLVMILAHLYPWILIHTLLPIIDGKMFPEWKSFVNRYKQHSRVNAPRGRGGTPHNCLYKRARKGHLFQDSSMRKVFKATRPSFLGGVPSYFEALWYPHLYFYHACTFLDGCLRTALYSYLGT